MSVPKSFEQVLREWREHGEHLNAAYERSGRRDTTALVHGGRFVACADEAQPILDKLREEVEKMPHHSEAHIAGLEKTECRRCCLERTLGERK